MFPHAVNIYINNWKQSETELIRLRLKRISKHANIFEGKWKSLVNHTVHLCYSVENSKKLTEVMKMNIKHVNP